MDMKVDGFVGRESPQKMWMDCKRDDELYDVKRRDQQVLGMVASDMDQLIPTTDDETTKVLEYSVL